MKKNLLRFFLSLVAVSVVLTWFWLNGLQIRYALLFRPAAQFAFQQLDIHQSGLTLVIEHFTNLIPFIALSLALPGVRLRKRLICLASGLVILAAVHFILIIVVSKIYSVHSLSKTAYKYMFPLFTINDALPLVLWFLFFPGEIIGVFRRNKKPTPEAKT